MKRKRKPSPMRKRVRSERRVKAESPLLSPRFERALVLANRLHARQKRKGTDIPYIAHLMTVAGLVLEAGGDEDMAIAALLHDAVEDQGGKPTLRMIREKFGKRVAGIVAGCTDSDAVPKPPWRQRKETYIAHLRHAPPEVRLVSASDKLHNARAVLSDYRRVGEALWPRFTGQRDGTLWYYRTLVDTFRAAGSNSVVDELGRVVAELEHWAAEAARKHADS
ncbi:MAG: HD domain-containing protein [Terriglobales bacterium]